MLHLLEQDKLEMARTLNLFKGQEMELKRAELQMKQQQIDKELEISAQQLELEKKKYEDSQKSKHIQHKLEIIKARKEAMDWGLTKEEALEAFPME